MSWFVHSPGSIYHRPENGLGCRQKQSNASFIAYLNHDGRFADDKSFHDSGEYFVLYDGVLLNKSELAETYGSRALADILVSLYEKEGEAFPRSLRGPFSGLLFDKLKNKLVFYTNQTGDFPVFFYDGPEFFAGGTDLHDFVQLFTENKIAYRLNSEAVKYMLTYGFLLNEHTFIDQVKRLRPGRVLILENGNYRETVYHVFTNTQPKEISFDQSLTLIDTAFKNAISRCFEKDLEYGITRHLVDMSGGLDSRMVNWVACSLGYENFTNISYSQSNSDEHSYASRAALALGNRIIHEQLDDASFFYDVDDIVGRNFGLGYYPGFTGGNHLLKSINMKEYGLEHTGQIGDVTIGTFCGTLRHTSPDPRKKRFSSKITDLVVETASYPNHELYLLYTRAFQGALSTHCIRRTYTEAVSPFLDVDFMTLCLSLPLRYRVNHRLYFAWVRRYYPNALRIKTTRQNKSAGVLSRLLYSINDKWTSFIVRIFLGLWKKGLCRMARPPKTKMNPFQFYYETNDRLRQFLNEYYFSEMALLHDDHIRSFLERSFSQGNIKEKLCVLTVLSVHKIFFRLPKGGADAPN